MYVFCISVFHDFVSLYLCSLFRDTACGTELRLVTMEECRGVCCDPVLGLVYCGSSRVSFYQTLLANFCHNLWCYPK